MIVIDIFTFIFLYLKRFLCCEFIMNYSIEEQNKDSNQIISLAIFIGFVSPTIPWFWTQLFFLKKPVATAIK